MIELGELFAFFSPVFWDHFIAGLPPACRCAHPHGACATRECQCALLAHEVKAQTADPRPLKRKGRGDA